MESKKKKTETENQRSKEHVKLFYFNLPGVIYLQTN